MILRCKHYLGTLFRPTWLVIKQLTFRHILPPGVIATAQMLAELLLLCVIFSSLISGFEIHQSSMDPTFHEGQRVIVNKLGSLMTSWLVGTAHAADNKTPVPFSPHRGQVVVFQSLLEANQTLIKRTIAVPGDAVALHDGAVFVNGQQLQEPYIHGQTTDCRSYCQPFTLGPDQYFMMGDNRRVSFDSRSFGSVPATKIIGSVVLRYWPPSQLEIYDQ